MSYTVGQIDVSFNADDPSIAFHRLAVSEVDRGVQEAVDTVVAAYEADYRECVPIEERSVEGLRRYAIVRFRLDDPSTLSAKIAERAVSRAMNRSFDAMRDAAGIAGESFVKFGDAARASAISVSELTRAFEGVGAALRKEKFMGVVTNVGASLLVAIFLAGAAEAQTTKRSAVYTNIVDGRVTQTIVREERDVKVGVVLPDSMKTSTPVLTKHDLMLLALGPTSYVPKPEPVEPSRQELPTPGPLYVNGAYMGPSPSGAWMAVTTKDPTINVNLVGSRPRERR